MLIAGRHHDCSSLHPCFAPLRDVPFIVQQSNRTVKLLSSMKTSLSILLLAQSAGFSSAFALSQYSKSKSKSKPFSLTCLDASASDLNGESAATRRTFLQFLPAVLLTTQVGLLPSNAVTPTGATDGNLVDLPPDAARSYLQYRIPLQTAADFYIFELQGLLSDVDQWGEVGQLFRTSNNRGQGQPSRIERDYINPMRILLLSMPPDFADDMRAAQFKFEAAMAKISKVTSGIRRDLPVEIDPSAVTTAKAGWEEGRVALNEFFVLLNEATGLKELKSIPAAGPNQREQFGRSAKRYNELVKKTKLCQNRGGPALSQAWGGLMVSGYMQDSCGIPDLEDYFYQ
jgi:hypothetical protein